jgi:hypothetical protein
MELLTRTWRDLRRLLAPDAWFTFAVLGVVLTVELVGRQQAATDFHDLCALLVLGGVVWLVVRKHEVTPLGWVTALGQLAQKLRDYLHKHYALEVGYDLRGSPPLPRGLPRLAIVFMLGLIVAVVVLLWFAEFMPLGLRALTVRFFYLGYLAGLAFLWLAIFATTFFVGFVIPFAMIHDALASRAAGRPRARRSEGTALSAYFACFFLAALYLPPWVPLLVCALAVVVNLVATVLPSNPNVQFLWRYRASGAALRSVPWPMTVTYVVAFVAMSIIDMSMLAAGSSLLGYTPTAADIAAAAANIDPNAPAQPHPPNRPPAPHEIMPITTSLGLTLAWLSSGALFALVVHSVMGRSRDPARPCRPVLRIQGSCPPEQRRAIERHFRQRGWKVSWEGKDPEKTAVRVEIVEQPIEEKPGTTRWPLRVTAEQLQSGEVFERLARRYEILMRRRLAAGLRRLFKMAAARSFRKGTGLLLAPHLWFIPGVYRDDQEDEFDLEQSTLMSGTIGLPYHRLWPRCVRHHLYLVLRALQIDLIFVEDGVGFRRFCRVLRMMFEIYDVHGGRRRADEVHFQGLPGIRVIIHEHRLDNPFHSDTYPEPDYETVARARILHVFKDRGEQEEPLETPEDFTNVPVTSGAM